MKTRTIKVDHLARVEGEGKLRLVLQGRQVVAAELSIFESPRYFEALLVGRRPHEAPDITARICGICPVAYQMSSIHAVERAWGMTPSPAIRALRRLLYCGEWLESHALHVLMLHAPDFLGLPGVVEMARQHRVQVEQGLFIKRVGNELVRLVGGREVHPVNVRLGGFYSAPSVEALKSLKPRLDTCLEYTEQLLAWVQPFRFPDFEEDYEYVALSHPEEYALNQGRLRSTRGLDLDVEEFPQVFEEYQVPHSHALHCRIRGRGAYAVGPLARLALNAEQLTPLARSAARRCHLLAPCPNPFRSILARLVEILFACEEALRLIQAYEPPSPSWVPPSGGAGVGAAATEAPRGLLYHRYEIDAEGLLKSIQIVPPTAQNQARMEADLRLLGPRVADLTQAQASWLCEQAIRNYDPCISCATHFLDVQVERA